MSRSRQEFKELLDTIDQTAHVYGQAPGNTGMDYPAIKFESHDEDVSYADNAPYNITDAYLVTVIETDPNTPIAKKVRALPLCRFNTSYRADNLNHTAYIIYF